MNGIHNLQELIVAESSTKTDVGTWLGTEFEKFVELLNEQTLGLTFIDLIISRPFEQEPFAGSAFPSEDRSRLYKSEVLKKMLAKGVALSMNEDFLRGTMNETKYPGGTWLQEDRSNSRVANENISKLLAQPQLEIIKELFDNDQHKYQEWKRKGQDTDIVKGFEIMVDLLSEWNIEAPLLTVCCVPIIIPKRNIQGTERDSENIGLIFFGISIKPGDEWDTRKLQIIRQVVSFAYTFALRSYSVSFKYIQELDRYRQLLESLQQPLRAITSSFSRLQSETQEMRAILNDPEVGIFESHAAIVPLFQMEVPIKISEFITLNPSHDYEGVSENSLRMALCYAIGAIFGVVERFRIAQTVEALEAICVNAIEEIRLRATRSSILEVMEVIFWHEREGTESWRLETAVEWKKNNIRNAGREKNQDRISTLKQILYTPFKDFGGRWPLKPIVLATFGVEVAKTLDVGHTSPASYRPYSSKEGKWMGMSPTRTPVPQHALINFILRMTRNAKASVSSLEVLLVGDDLKTLSFALHTPFYKCDADGRTPANPGNLCECIESTFKFGASGTTFGDFHGIFQALLRHCLSTGHGFSELRTGTWANVTRSAIKAATSLSSAIIFYPLLVLAKSTGEKGAFDKIFCITETHSRTDRPETFNLDIIWEDVSPRDKETDMLKNAMESISVRKATLTAIKPILIKPQSLPGSMPTEAEKQQISRSTELQAPIQSESVPALSQASTPPMQSPTSDQTVRIALLDHDGNYNNWVVSIQNEWARRLSQTVNFVGVPWREDIDPDIFHAIIVHLPNPENNGKHFEEFERIILRWAEIPHVKILGISRGGDSALARTRLSAVFPLGIIPVGKARIIEGTVEGIEIDLIKWILTR